MKTLTAILVSPVFASAAASAQTTNTPTPTAGVQAFLNVLNSGKGKPMEQMTPQEARQVLIGAQQGAKLPLLWQRADRPGGNDLLPGGEGIYSAAVLVCRRV